MTPLKQKEKGNELLRFLDHDANEVYTKDVLLLENRC